MGMLAAIEATAFEDHYVGCPRCASIVENAQQYVRAMKTAAQRLRPKSETLRHRDQALRHRAGGF
jgi:hypothetical protein